MRNISFYSASDKVIFDALNQYKVTKQDIRALFFQRGTLISDATDKEKLALDFSAYLHDYNDYSYLATILGVATRREKATSFDLITSVSFEDIETTARELTSIVSTYGDTIEVNVVNNRIELSVLYRTCDFTKSELRQIVDKDLKVTIEKNDNSTGYTVRGSQSDKFNEVSDILIDKLSQMDPDFSKDEISLFSIVDSKIRRSFFDRLTKEIPKHDYHDVTDVYVINPDQETDEEKVVHITKASLKGKGVTFSKELTDLFKQGFYIWKIVWNTVLKDEKESDIYEFEALFEDPINCKKFSYIAKGYYRFKENDDGTTSNHSKNRMSLRKSQEDNLHKLIESTAKKIINDLLSSLS